MNPRICTVKSEPPHTHSDCVRACIASLIDRDDVPHVFHDYGKRPVEDAWAELREYLAQHKKVLAIFPVDNHAEFMSQNNNGVTYMLFCGTGRGDHAVICRNGEVVHDPAWYRAQITGPHSMGFYIVGIIGDLI